MLAGQGCHLGKAQEVLPCCFDKCWYCCPAEEGPEILKEMSQMAMLEALTVDSTDEFGVDPGFQPFHSTTNLVKWVWC